jgi:hypothetical protein
LLPAATAVPYIHLITISITISACDQEFPLNRVGRGADGRKARAYLVTIVIHLITISSTGSSKQPVGTA